MFINFWYPICTTQELNESNPRRAELLGVRLVVFRDADDTAHVLADTCIHRGGSLSRGKVVGNCVQCPYHGWQFAGDGRCVRIPSQGDGKPPPRAKVDSYPVQECYGIVFAFLGDLADEERPPLFAIPEWGLDGWRPSRPWVRDIQCYYERSVENGLDPVHNEFVHPSQGLPKMREDSVVYTELVWGVHFIAAFGELDEKASGETELAANPDQLRAGSLYHGPNTLVTDIHFNATNTFVQYAFEAPIDDRTTRLYLINMRNCMLDPAMDERVVEINARVADEDAVVLQELWPIHTPDTNTRELLTSGDAMVLRYREHLREWERRGWRIDRKRLRELSHNTACAIPSPARRTAGNWILPPVPLVMPPD